MPPCELFYEVEGALSNQSFDHPPDCVISFTVDTLPSSGNINIYFRYVAGNNCLQAQISSTGAWNLFERTPEGTVGHILSLIHI